MRNRSVLMNLAQRIESKAIPFEYMQNLTNGYSFRKLKENSNDNAIQLDIDGSIQDLPLNSNYYTNLNSLGSSVKLTKLYDQIGNAELIANSPISLNQNGKYHLMDLSNRNLSNSGIEGECLSVVLKTNDTNAILFNKSWTRLMYMSQTSGAILQQGTGSNNEYYVNGNLIANDRQEMIDNVINKGVVVITIKNVNTSVFNGDFNINGFYNQSYGFSGEILELITAPNSEAENIMANQKTYYQIS
ncbi:MAG: hypothetical protein N4A45_10285 [Flavobacteriales bacterium]|jgi:hypothetical protein|nr:hypothetical protein [Flavobacteriales bacterium]